MDEKEFNKYVDEMCKSIGNLLENHEEELIFIITLIKTFNQVCEERKKLQQQVKKQQEMIDKAISYINKYSTDENGDIGINLFSYNCVELLDILGETSK